NVFAADSVDLRTKRNQLFVPRFDLVTISRRITRLACLAKQMVLLFHDVVVLSERRQVSGSDRDHAAIHKPPALGRISPDHVELFEREHKHVEVSEVASKLLALCVEVEVL